MPKTLRLADDLVLPLDIVTRRTAIVGQTDTGKTSTAVVLVEEAKKVGAQVVVLEPSGAWWGLASSADGQGPGLDMVVMGGEHGDVPLNEHAGRACARLVAEEGYSVVLDLDRPHFTSWASRQRFAADFLSELYELARSQILLVVDEAHRFAPQAVRDESGDAARCLGAFVDVVALGRRRGLAVVAITQRLAKLHKDVLELCEVFIAHRLRGKNDRAAAQSWLENAGEDVKAVMTTVAGLERGVAHVSAPTLGVDGVFRIRPKETFDSSASIPPGEAAIEPKVRSDIDLAALETRMAETIEQERAEDPKALREKIEELESKLADGPDSTELEELRTELEERRGWANVTQSELDSIAEVLGIEKDAPHNAVVDRVRVLAARPDVPPGMLETTRQVAGMLRSQSHALTRDAEAFVRAAGALEGAVGSQAGAGQDGPEPAPQEAEPVEPTAPPSPTGGGRPGGDQPYAERRGPATGEAGPPIKAGGRRILDRLARYHPRPLTKREVATLANVATGGTFSSYLSTLRSHGLITDNGDELTLSAKGAQEWPPSGGRLSPEEVVALHAPRLKAGARRILNVLMRAREQGFTRSELARLADVSAGGTFSSYLSTLRSRGLIEERAKRVFAHPTIYLAESS